MKYKRTNAKDAYLTLNVNAKVNAMTDIECLAKLEAVIVENMELTTRVQLLEKLNEGFIAVNDPYEDLKKENAELKEQIEYLKQKLFNLWGVPKELIENASIKTATQISEYENKKFIEHLKKNLAAAINSCYTEPKNWDDFVGNSTSINDSKYFI